MAISINGAAALTITMTDAEFLLMNNGVSPGAGPTAVQPNGTFGNLIGTQAPGGQYATDGITAGSSAGVTTVTIPVGRKHQVLIESVLTRLRRAQQAYNLTWTP